MSRRKQYKKNAVKNETVATPAKQPTKKWWMLVVKFSVLILLGVSAVIICDHKKVFPPDKYYLMLNYKRWDSFYEIAENDSIDIILLGNSHVYNGINPTFLSNILGCNCFILADASNNSRDNYFALQEALEISRPKLVVLETHGICQRDAINKDEYSSILSFDARKNRKLKLRSMPYLFSVDNYLPPWSMTLRNHNRILEAPDHISSNSKRYNLIMQDKGIFLGNYVRYKTGMTDSVLHLYDSLGVPDNENEWVIADDELIYLHKIQELCEAHNIDLMLLTLPMYYKCIPDYSEIKENNLRKLVDMDIPWLDLQHPYDTSIYLPSCFENSYNSNLHLNYDGSMAASIDLARFIHDSIKTPLPIRFDENRLGGKLYDEPGYWLNNTPSVDDTNNHILLKDTVLDDYYIKDLTINKDQLLVLKIKHNDTPPETIKLDVLVLYYGVLVNSTITLYLFNSNASFYYDMYNVIMRQGVEFKKLKHIH